MWHPINTWFPRNAAQMNYVVLVRHPFGLAQVPEALAILLPQEHTKAGMLRDQPWLPFPLSLAPLFSLEKGEGWNLPALGQQAGVWEHVLVGFVLWYLWIRALQKRQRTWGTELWKSLTETGWSPAQKLHSTEFQPELPTKAVCSWLSFGCFSSPKGFWRPGVLEKRGWQMLPQHSMLPKSPAPPFWALC